MSPHTALQVPVTLSGGKGEGHKDVDKETKDVEETAQSFDQNLSGTATLENTSAMAKCNWPAISYKCWHWLEVPAALFVVNFVNCIYR